MATTTTAWSPLTWTQSPYAVLILNCPITVNNFNSLWNNAGIRVCVDGGANRLFDLSIKSPTLKTPHLISGDFDSILDEVKNHYEKEGVKIVCTPDQDYTDFTKALKIVEDGISAGDFCHVDFIVVLDGEGRLDQTFANICTLFKTNLKVLQLHGESISWLLRTGKHVIKVDDKYIAANPHCGLIPLCGVTKMKTAGLKWNLDGEYHFQGIISTSNSIVEETALVETDQDTLWTMDYLPS